MSIRDLTPAFVATVSAMAGGLACNPPNVRSVEPAPRSPSAATSTSTAVSTPASAAAPDSPSAATSSSATASAGVSASPSATASASENPPRNRGLLNPLDPQKRRILKDHRGAGCHVFLPFPPLKPGEQRVPGSAPPRQPVVCPAVMLDKAFESCRGGTLRTKGKSCLCMQYGNPPRQFVSPCPADT